MRATHQGDELEAGLQPKLLSVIATHTPFPLPEIESAYKRLESYDVTITATLIACEQNMSLSSAVDLCLIRISIDKVRDLFDEGAFHVRDDDVVEDK